MGTISFNPMVTNQPQSSFLLQSQGYVQGLMYDDPVALQLIETGVLDATVTGSIYAGTALALNINAVDANELGNNIKLATAVTDLEGWLVGNKLYNGIIVPGNSVPTVTGGQTASLVKLGSGARIAVNCDPALAASLASGSIGQSVAWDFTNQKLIAYTSGTALPVKVLSTSANSKIVSTASGVTWTTGTCAIIQI